MSEKGRIMRRISLILFAVAALVTVSMPVSHAVAPPPAPNNRCGPRTNPACNNNGLNGGALDVATATTPRTSTRQTFQFDTTATTSGPLGVDVLNPGIAKDIWFRFAGPHCPNKKIIINASGSSYTAESFLLTQGGGAPPFIVCDTTCAAVAGTPFFALDVVVNSTTGNYNITIPAILSARNLFTLVSGGAGGTLNYSVTTFCP